MSSYAIVRPIIDVATAGSTGFSNAAITSRGPGGQTATGRGAGSRCAGAVPWPSVVVTPPTTSTSVSPRHLETGLGGRRGYGIARALLMTRFYRSGKSGGT